jgi:hypothetical protein
MVGKLTKGKLLEKRVCVSNVGILTSVWKILFSNFNYTNNVL